ncbi:sulfite exporter TauE/SafE family protein 3-like isoform X1 [Hordeum vulgare subsp. vulgare]|uniref:Sulfite exporter TauE/SafE family protein n=2 Tax=Hordeum vulgare subsp. vulgare TaxID=112509 RepID=A0A8I6XE90_HORVV|nr:sulfite exporter TauE/SafE family protein 3-like isoform X1 [Hordeum vulgare subsp. vulgare]
MGRKWCAVTVLAITYMVATTAVAANDKGLSFAGTAAPAPEEASSLRKPVSLDGTAHHHVWPTLNAGWRTVLGSFIGFFGAALGSIGGVGGGGIFVPMLTLIVGFDTKSATAMSKCMITGAAVSTVYCNLKLKHPTLNMPMIDYDLALLIQPMLMMGVSIGVICNVIFPDWLVTVLFIILSLVTSTKAFLKGVETWKKETLMKREAAVKKSKQSSDEIEYTPPTGSDAIAEPRAPSDEAVSIWKNIYWKEFGLLIFVWVAILTLQVAMNYTATCSTMYWVFSLLQIPVSAGVSVYQAVGLVQGKRVISSRANTKASLKSHIVLIYFFGVSAGVLAGLLGLGGGVIMGPLFLELGIPPQVSSATATFAMMFSSSIAVVEYYLLNRFPIPYALVFTCVAFIAAIVGQRVARKVINWLGRASLIIFILSFMIFIGLIPLGGFGILNINHKMAQHEYMGFHSICKSDT